jgi:hypothetical protein
LDLAVVFALIELILGAAMAGFGAWQYITAAPLPGVLGRPMRAGQKLEDQPPVRWQISGGSQALFGVGFLMFGTALLFGDHLSGGALQALKGLGLVAWLIAVVLLILLVTRYRRPV